MPAPLFSFNLTKRPVLGRLKVYDHVDCLVCIICTLCGFGSNHNALTQHDHYVCPLCGFKLDPPSLN